MFFPNWIVLLFNAGTKQGKVSQGETLKFKAADAKSKDTDSITTLKFKVPSDFGRPGAILVEHKNNNEFFLKAITLHGLSYQYYKKHHIPVILKMDILPSRLILLIRHQHTQTDLCTIVEYMANFHVAEKCIYERI